MSLKSRRRMMLYKPLDDALWNNRLGYFNKSYTTQNDWWLNGDYSNGIVSCMNAAKNLSGATKRYFFVGYFYNKWQLYVSDEPVYVVPVNNKYLLVYTKNTIRYIDGSSSGIGAYPYDIKDGVQYYKDHSNRNESTIKTIISNYPIFGWNETIPSDIPTEGGAVTNLYS